MQRVTSILFVAASLFGCGARPVVLERGRAGPDEFPGVASIRVFEPNAEFVDVRTGRRAPKTDRASDAVAALRTALLARLDELGIAAESVAGPPNSAIHLTLAETVRSTPASSSPGRVTCAAALTGKIGRGGGWNPNTGQIWASTHTTILTIVVFAADGRRLWRRQVLWRGAPTAQRIKRAVNNLIFSTNSKEKAGR